MLPLRTLAALSLVLFALPACVGDNSDAVAGGEGGSIGAQDAALEDATVEKALEETATADVPVAVQSPCDDHPDCRTDQRCVDHVCKDHLVCDSELIWDETGCSSHWFDCEDGKEYKFFCLNVPNHDWECHCLVNDVPVKGEVLAINWQAVCPGVNESLIHRIANEYCDWLMPKLDVE